MYPNTAKARSTLRRCPGGKAPIVYHCRVAVKRYVSVKEGVCITGSRTPSTCFVGRKGVNKLPGWWWRKVMISVIYWYQRVRSDLFDTWKNSLITNDLPYTQQALFWLAALFSYSVNDMRKVEDKLDIIRMMRNIRIRFKCPQEVGCWMGGIELDAGTENRKNTVICGKITVFGTPGETRTHYLTLRRRTLYPGELRGRAYEIVL